jgi:hypothetical protein
MNTRGSPNRRVTRGHLQGLRGTTNSETLTRPGHGRPRVVHVNQPPALVRAPGVNLAFPAGGVQGLPVVPARGDEIPVEFDDRRIAVDVHGRWAHQPQGALSEHRAHGLLVEVLRHLFPATLMSAGMDEGHLGARGPKGRSQLGIGALHRTKVSSSLTGQN